MAIGLSVSMPAAPLSALCTVLRLLHSVFWDSARDYSHPLYRNRGIDWLRKELHSYHKQSRCQDLDANGLGPAPVLSCTGSHRSEATEPELKEAWLRAVQWRTGWCEPVLALTSALPMLSIFSVAFKERTRVWDLAPKFNIDHVNFGFSRINLCRSHAGSWLEASYVRK